MPPNPPLDEIEETIGYSITAGASDHANRAQKHPEPEAHG
jgi:hypothetical protein